MRFGADAGLLDELYMGRAAGSTGNRALRSAIVHSALINQRAVRTGPR